MPQKKRIVDSPLSCRTPFEGGAIVTNDDQLAEKVRLMRNFGFAGLDNVIHPGTNGKMAEVCAAMGLANLDYVDSFIETNRRNYYAYRDTLTSLPGITVLGYDETQRNNFQYVVIEVGPESAANRDEIVAALNAENVLARKYFWPGCHRMEPYRVLFPHASLLLPNTTAVAERVAVLPTGTTISLEQIDFVTRLIRRVAAAA